MTRAVLLFASIALVASTIAQSEKMTQLADDNAIFAYAPAQTASLRALRGGAASLISDIGSAVIDTSDIGSAITGTCALLISDRTTGCAQAKSYGVPCIQTWKDACTTPAPDGQPNTVTFELLCPSACVTSTTEVSSQTSALKMNKALLSSVTHATAPLPSKQGKLRALTDASTMQARAKSGSVGSVPSSLSSSLELKIHSNRLSEDDSFKYQTVDLNAGQYPTEVSWNVDAGTTYSAFENPTLWLDSGSHIVNLLDSYGDGWNNDGATWTLICNNAKSGEVFPCAGPFGSDFTTGTMHSKLFTVP